MSAEDSPCGMVPKWCYDEEISVRLVPLSQITQMVAAGAVHYALVVAAFHLLLLEGVQ